MKPAAVDSLHDVGGRVAGLPRVSMYNEAADAQRAPRRNSIPATSSAPQMSPAAVNFANDKSASAKVMLSVKFTVNYSRKFE